VLVIERYFGSGFSLDRLRNVLGLLTAAIVATAASGIGGTVAYKLFHSPMAPIWTTWRNWFASDAIGIITVAPLVIGLAEALREPPLRTEILEGVVALVALAVMTVAIVLLPSESWQTAVPVALLFPILLWIAACCQPVFAAAAAFIVSLTITWRELGGPPVTASVQSGYGSNLIRDLIPHDLGGAVDLMFPSDGVSCGIEIPLRCSPSAKETAENK
jgi:MASE1